MELVEKINLKNIINDSLKKSITYKNYRALVGQLVENKSTTGNETSEAMVNYTMLNDRRMKRWDKTVKITEEVRDKLAGYKGDVTWLVITESWCGDAAHVVPVLYKVAELNDYIYLKVVLRDENEALMDKFLTHGAKAIPKLIMIDNTTGEVVNTYGPRPSKATKMVNAYKAEHGQLTPEFKEDLQYWYNNDKGQTAIKDLLKLLEL
jgi:thiol-disulfide isomerase/thioredoxin